jgi:hypothetical protein
VGGAGWRSWKKHQPPGESFAYIQRNIFFSGPLQALPRIERTIIFLLFLLPLGKNSI